MEIFDQDGLCLEIQKTDNKHVFENETAEWMKYA